LRLVDYCFVSTDYLIFCYYCWGRTKVAATAVAAATFGGCYANALAAAAVTGSFCPRHRHWLIVAFWIDFLFAILPLCPYR